MAPFGWVIFAQTCDRTPSPTKVLQILVGDGASPGSKVERGAGHRVVWEMPLHLWIFQLKEVEHRFCEVGEGGGMKFQGFYQRVVSDWRSDELRGADV